MNLELVINADHPHELEEAIKELAASLLGRATPLSVEEHLDKARALLAGQGMDVRVVSKAKMNAASASAAAAAAPVTGPNEETAEDGSAEAAEPQDEPEVAKAKKKRGGQPKLSKEDAAEALSAETPAARKARCVAKLQAMFADGRKADVMKILAEHGGGAKTFAAVAEDKFEPISDALAVME
jgi:hypothetical protein